MKLNVNSKQLLAMTALGITTGAGTFFCCAKALPAFAEDTKAQFIDKDFEMALKKHFERRFFDRINASDEQREKISALLSARLEATRPLREELRAGALELTELMGADTPDTTLTEKAHNLRDKRDKLADERLQTILKVRALLTAEQRKQISNRIADALSGGSNSLILRRLQKSSVID
ncbi:MAG TPA: Spy/CpxP family protein refolding chaperone [Oculatellaceae cyanobacterium]